MMEYSAYQKRLVRGSHEPLSCPIFPYINCTRKHTELLALPSTSTTIELAMFTSLFRPLAVVLGAALALPASASPLVRRDVIAPTITSPTAESVWPIGTVQTVTWYVSMLRRVAGSNLHVSHRDTSNFPPVSQITNILGEVILGFQANNSLNLDFGG